MAEVLRDIHSCGVVGSMLACFYRLDRKLAVESPVFLRQEKNRRLDFCLLSMYSASEFFKARFGLTQKTVFQEVLWQVQVLLFRRGGT